MGQFGLSLVFTSEIPLVVFDIGWPDLFSLKSKAIVPPYINGLSESLKTGSVVMG